MERLTFEGNFCDIAQCSEVRYGSFCEDGYCSQRRVWEKLKRYEDLEEQGRVVEIAEWEDCSEIIDNTVCGRAEFKYKRCSNCKQPMGLSGDKHCGNCGAKMKLSHAGSALATDKK